MEKKCLSIVFLNDKDPHNEVLHTYANYTLKQAIGYYRADNRKATAIVCVHDEGMFTCLGRLTDVELQLGGEAE